MDNKSELSKPVAWKFKNADGGDRVSLERKSNIYGRHDFQPLYSQGYVSALLAGLEAKDDALRAIAFHVSAGGYNADSVDAEVFKQKIIDGINGISDVFVKRLAELEAIRAAAEKLVRCKGRYHSEQNYRSLAALFGVTTPDLSPVEGDSEAVIAELRAKLATPVRLPTTSGRLGVAYTRVIPEVIEAIRAAGFTVEGDE